MLHDKPSANNHLACLLKSIIFAEGDSESGLLAQRRVGGARRRGGELDCSCRGGELEVLGVGSRVGGARRRGGESGGCLCCCHASVCMTQFKLFKPSLQKVFHVNASVK